MKKPPPPPLIMSQLPQFVRLARDTDLMDARLMTFLTRNEQLLARAADEHLPVDARVQDHVLLLVVRATSHFRRDEVVSIASPPRSVVGSNRLLKRICGVEEPHPSRMAVLFVADGEGYPPANSRPEDRLGAQLLGLPDESCRIGTTTRPWADGLHLLRSTQGGGTPTMTATRTIDVDSWRTKVREARGRRHGLDEGRCRRAATQAPHPRLGALGRPR